jgi:chromatin remodeling complex protein RSC6
MPKKKTSTSKPKSSKAVVKTTAPKVVEKAAAEKAAVEQVTVTSPTLNEQFTELLAQLQKFRSQLTSVTTQVRALSKRTDRELKQALKSSRKKKSSGNRQPSGFVKPTKISVELAKFLGKPMGTEMARTAVTREINNYIKAHDLQDKGNGRIILPDSKLRKLLKLKKDEELTYFNLQKYMSPHFAKAVSKSN